MITQEHQLIPYHTSPLPQGPWLVFAPHPDDETFGMGGTLLLAKRREIGVALVILTNETTEGTQQQDTLAVVREEEAREATRRLGITDIQFWKQPDRALKVTEVLVKRVVELVQATQPGSVFFPSSLELHPDHRMAAALIWKGLRRCPKFTGTAYSYEIGTQGPINLLIDITEVAEEKFAIMGVYNSQLTEHNYLQIVKALNVARTYTLPKDVKYAEGFYAYERKFHQELAFPILSSLQSYWQLDTRDDFPLVSVIIRTKDRPELLKEAIQSVVKQTYSNIELVIVNDGGQDVSELVNAVAGKFSHVQYISLETNQGRAIAANKGLDIATGDYLIFLDDDDLFDPHHIATLVDSFKQHPQYQVAYTGARFESKTLNKIYNRPYDKASLGKENYIPLHTLMFARELLTAGCRFDERLAVFEDWDFLLQLSQFTDFWHVIQISATYRSFGTSRVTFHVDRHQTDEFRSMVVEKWKLHAQSPSSKNVFVLQKDDTVCKQKQPIQQLYSQVYAQLFINTGSGFFEKQSVYQEISGNETQLEFTLEEYDYIKALRFDPLNTRTVIQLERIEIISEEHPMPGEVPYQTNALYEKDGICIFETLDPNIYIDTRDIFHLQKVIIHLEYLAWGAETYKYIAQERASIIHSKEQEIQTQGQILRAREQELQQLTHDLQTREQELQQLTHDLQTREQELQHLTHDLHTREQELQHLTHDLHKREQEIQQFTHDLHTQKQERQQLTHDLHTREQELQQFTHDLQTREQEIQQLTYDLQIQEQEIQQLTHNLQTREQEIHQQIQILQEKDLELYRKNQKIQAIYHTFSWRITRPLRGIWNILHLSELFYGLRKTITYIRTRIK